jgi:hypothetical protein
MWQVIFQKQKNGDVSIMYTGEVNLYEFIGLLDIEKEKLKQNLIEKVKSN